MRFDTKFSYNRFQKQKTKYLRWEDDKIFNGPFEVTDAVKHLKGVVKKDDPIRLIDYLVHRPLPKQIRELGILPKVHPQSYEMQLYYKRLNKALNEGVWVSREYFNPFFIFWLSIFVFEIPLYDKKGNLLGGSEIGRPLYSTVDRYIFDIMWKAFINRQYVAFLSGRGLGKSFITGAVQAWFYMLFDNQEIIVSATSEPLVEEAWTKLVDTLNFIEEEYPGFKQKRLKGSSQRIIAGEEYTDNLGDKKIRGSKNDVRRILYGDNPDATRGRRPHFQHIEEFAAFPSYPAKGSLKNVLGHSKGSWIIQGSIKKAFVVMTGTGGSVANRDAEDIFTNPRGNNLIIVDEWGKETSLFIPSYLKYGGTWEKTGTPNITIAMEQMAANRKNLEADPIMYIQELQEFPMTLDEVFLIRGTNIFNQDKIAEQLAKLAMVKTKPYKVGKLDYIMNKAGDIQGIKFREAPDGKIIIVEMPENADGMNLPMNNLYVAGVDSIDQGVKDSLIDGSKLAMAIKKRVGPNMFKTSSNIYAAFYNERSDDVRWDYENVLKLSMFYNCRINLEYTKINILSFFRAKGQLWRFLHRPSIAIGSNVSGAKASTLIGTPATSAVISHQDQKWADYIEDEYSQILYPPVLEQSRDYTANNRTKFDFVVACGLTELADEDMLGKPASLPVSASEGIRDFGFYRDRNGRKRWGVPPQDEEEIKSIAQEFIDEAGETPTNFSWVDASTPIN